MNREENVKVLKESLGCAVVALGVYNVLILIRYFKNGRDKSIISGDLKLYLSDLAVFAATFVLILFIELIRRKLHKNRRSDSSGGSEG